MKLQVPTTANPTEAKKTEPDKNTYLVFKDGLPGADPSYDYGTHFLFQGHEIGSPGYITRINLDAEARCSSRKSNMPLSVPAFTSEESAPILPRSQLSSMKRRIDD